MTRKYDVTLTAEPWFVLTVLVVLIAAAALATSWMRRRAAGRAAAAVTEARGAAARDRHRLLLRLDHELKNPLTALTVGLANLSSSAAGWDQRDRGVLDSVSAQTTRLTRLTTDLRKLAELETAPIESAPVDIAEVLAEVGGAIADEATARGVVVRRSVPEAPWPLPAVPGDRDLIALAVHNLAWNAVKFSHPGSVLEMRAAEDGDSVVVEVADTGMGIPADEVDEVWDELARGAAARGIPGSGLGLTLVRAVAQRHGGSVSLRSRPGEGTVVSMRLPVGTRTAVPS